MIHQRILQKHLDQASAGLSDEAREALVFKQLEERKQRWATEAHGVPILRFPDDRTLLQRLTGWWRLRRHRMKPTPDVKPTDSVIMVEPKWAGHWATTKYL